MTPSITWKGGGPLMTAGGLIGGSDKCCCENPPPPVCECADYCPYIVEVTSPSGLAVKSPPAFCDGTGGYASRNPAAALTNFGCSPSGWEYISPVGYEPTDASIASVSLNGDNARIGIASVVAQELGTFTKKFPNQYLPSGTMDYYVGGSVSCSIQIYCDRYGEQGPPNGSYFAIATFFAFFGIGNSLFVRWHQRGKQIGFELPSYCSAPGQRVCGDVGDSRVRYLNLPADITVGGLTTSAGNYTADNVVYSSLEQIEKFAGQEVVDYIDCVIAAATATFRITSRPDCKPPVVCTCGANLQGLQLTFDGWTYSIGEQVADPGEDGDQRLERYYFIYGNQHTIIHAKYVLNENGTFYDLTERTLLNIYCQSTADGPRWYAYFETQCITQTSYVKDSWMGYFTCVAACADPDNGRSAGDSIPSGYPVEIEYLGRETYPGYATCTPTGRPPASIHQPVAC